jgi:hypothetical protein
MVLGGKTLVIFKSQVLILGIESDVMNYLSNAGGVIQIRKVDATRKISDKHFSDLREWIEMLGKKATDTCRYFKVDPKIIHGTSNLYGMGKNWGMELLSLFKRICGCLDNAGR